MRFERHVYRPRFGFRSVVALLVLALAAASPGGAAAQVDPADQKQSAFDVEVSQPHSELGELNRNRTAHDLADVMSEKGRLTSHDVKGVAPADIEAAGELLRERHAIVAADDTGSKRTGAGLIMRGRVGNDLSPGSEEADATDAMNMEAQAVASHRANQAATAKAPWYAKLGEVFSASWSIMLAGLVGLTGFVTSWKLYKNRKRNVRN